MNVNFSVPVLYINHEYFFSMNVSDRQENVYSMIIRQKMFNFKKILPRCASKQLEVQ